MLFNKFFVRLFFLGLLFFQLTHCSPENTSIPLTENEVFNQLILEAPATIIDLDEIPVDTVIVTSEQALGREKSSFFSEPIYLGFPTLSFVKIKDSLYVAHNHGIHVMDTKGVWQRSVGRRGQGPGEFDSSFKLTNNSKNILALDYGNGRIHVYDNKLRLINTVNTTLFNAFFIKDFALTDNHLFMGLGMHSQDHVVAVHRTDDLQTGIETFWPRIIPAGLQPGPYNSIALDVNRNGDIAITNLGLPYLFLLSPNREIEHTIFFESSYYRESENPSAKPVRTNGNTEHDVPGVKHFISQLVLKNNHTIFFTISNTLYQIVRSEDKYRLHKVWHFVHEDPLLRQATPNGINIGSMVIEDGALYFISMNEEYLFKVELD